MKSRACIPISKSFVALACALAAVALATRANAAIFVDTWENPILASGGAGTLPAPWTVFSGSAGSALVVHPTSADFSQADPLAAPAGGNQMLRLIGQNTGISRLSGDSILPNTIYTLSAAIGNDLQSVLRNDSWSLQLWADANGSGGFEGSGFDVFLGQQFGTNLGAVNPAPGQWALNSISFDSALAPSLVGKQLIVFLNNFDLPNSASFYDNVALTTGTAAAVPEPASVLLWSSLAGVLSLARWNRNTRRKLPQKNAPQHARSTDLRPERLEDRLALAAFGPADGAYVIEPWTGTYEAVEISPGNQGIVAMGDAIGASKIARYDLLGNLDTGYGMGGAATTAVRDGCGTGAGDTLVLQADGKAVVAGSVQSSKYVAAGRLNAAGQTDSSFDGDGVSALIDVPGGQFDAACAVAVQSTGKIVAVGRSYYPTYSAVVARYLPSGIVDSGKGGFGESIKGRPAGFTRTTFGLATGVDNFWGVAIQPDDKIVAVGEAADNRVFVARYTASGVLDTSFNGTGYSLFLPPGVEEGKALAVVLQNDGKIIVGGNVKGLDFDPSAYFDMFVARFNSNGTLDTGFGGGNGYVLFDVDGLASTTSESATAIALQPDGKIVTAGTLWSPATPARSVLLTRWNTDGSPDLSFGSRGVKLGTGPNGRGFSGSGVAIQTDGSIIVAGRDGVLSGTADNHPLLMRFYGDNAPAAEGTTDAAAMDAALLYYLTEDLATPPRRR